MAGAALSSPAESDSDQEHLLPTCDARRSRKVSGVAAVAAAAASLVGIATLLACVALFVLLGAPAPAAAASAPGPLTVRALFDGDEFGDLATDNLMAMHGEALSSSGRSHVRTQVARSLRRIDEELLQQYPEDHEQLALVVVNDTEKEAVLRMLRKYGDARLIKLTRELAGALEENAQVQGSDEALEERVASRLRARLPELRQMSREMFPGGRFALNLTEVPGLGAWHPGLEVDLGSAPRATARRLATLDDVDGGVRAHAETLFESLRAELGERMPKAPARMLQSSSSDDGKGHEAFIACLTHAVPHPTKIASCMMHNMQSLMSLCVKYAKKVSPF